MNGLHQKAGVPDARFKQLEQAVLGGESVRVAVTQIYGYRDAYYKATTKEQQAHILQCKPCSSPGFKSILIRMPTERVIAAHAAAGKNKQSLNRWCGRVILEAIKREAERGV